MVGKKGDPRNFKPPQEHLDRLANLLQKHNLTSSSMFKSIRVDKTSALAQPDAEETPETHPMVIEMLGSKLDMISSCDFVHKIWGSVPAATQTFYKSSIELMPGEEVKIFEQTLKQTLDERWYKERKHRMTSTKAHKIVGGRKAVTRIGYMYPKKENKMKDHKNFRYGREMEPTAKAVYEEIYNTKVHPAGLVICHEQPWLACSPDGFVIDEEQDTLTVLEVKCPITCRDAKIKDLDYLDYKLCPVEGTMKPTLKKTHEYYMQVQIQLYVCKAKRSHFFVFSMADHIKIDIDIDPHFL